MGLVLLWKPQGVSSQQHLGQFKAEHNLPGKGRKGIGHNGTLDPFAEGLLLVGYGEGLKLIHPLEGLDKTYIAELVFGVPSDSHDSTGALEFELLEEASSKAAQFNETQLQKFLESKIGTFDQIPPQFSAKHVDGKRAYDWARQGVVKELKPKRVELKLARHLAFESRKDAEQREFWVWRFEVEVSAGCYIRAFARDWGVELLGVEGHLSLLHRVGMGPYSLESGQFRKWLSLEDLEKLFDIKEISSEDVDVVRNGRPWEQVSGERAQILLGPEGFAVAWLEAHSSKIKRVFVADPLSAT